MNKKLEVKPKSPSPKPRAETHRRRSDDNRVRYAHTLQGYEQALKLLQAQKFEKARPCLKR